MRVGRTILAFLVALGLAMLPVAHAFAVQEEEFATSDVQVASAHECCHDDGMPDDPAMKECRGSAACIAKCSNVFAVVLPAATIFPPMGGLESIFAENSFCSHTGSPPFRPPPV
jgi:hypothetical protein